MKIEMIIGSSVDVSGVPQNNSILISELDTKELEKVRSLLKAILVYGQFDDAKEAAEGLSLDSIIEQMILRRPSVKS